MALLLFEGFDLDHLPVGVSTVGLVGGSPNSIATAYTTGRLGGRSLRHGAAFNGTTVNARAFDFTAHTTGFHGFAYRNENAAQLETTEFFQVCEGTTIHLGIRRNAAGQIELVRGGTTVLATSAATFDHNTWNYLEVGYTIDDAAGACTVRLNGVTVIAVTGADTRNGGTGVCNRVQFVARGTNSAQYINIDDWYYLDATGAAPYNTFLGDCKVETIRPNGNGASSGWVGSDGNSVDNYLLVDDPSPVNTTDYVGSATSGAKDTYAMTNLSAPSAGYAHTVLAAQVETYLAKSDAGTPPDVQEVVRHSGGTEAVATIATAVAMTTTFAWFVGALRLLDPTGAAWSTATVDALEVGVKIP